MLHSAGKECIPVLGTTLVNKKIVGSSITVFLNYLKCSSMVKHIAELIYLHDRCFRNCAFLSSSSLGGFVEAMGKKVRKLLVFEIGSNLI